MVTIILDAKRIPDGTVVRKITGSVTCVLERQIKIYCDGDVPSDLATPIAAQGVVFLLNDGNINAYPDTAKFAVDLSEDDAVIFLMELSRDK